LKESLNEKYLKYFIAPLIIAILVLILTPLSMNDKIFWAIVIVVISVLALLIYNKWRSWSYRKKPLDVSFAKVPL
jgi:membrane protein YdbS with pleckstrin-like domain